MPVRSTLARASLVPSVLGLRRLLSLPPRVRLLLAFSGLLTFLVKYLRVKSTKRATGGGYYVEDLSKVGSTDESKDAWSTYDVIIVGGGTSGCALAARLSENSNIRVLLLEAGGSGTALIESRTPSMFGRLFKSKHVHQLRTEVQVFAREKRKFWPRARMLGGCSSINAQMAQYGAPGDFDEWARIIGDDSWSSRNLRQYFNKFETYRPHVDYPLVDASVRGKSGPIQVGYNNYVSELSGAFISSCINIGIPFIPDFNGPRGTIGVSRLMTYIDNMFQRVSSESAYLTSEVLMRKNVVVVTNTTVTRIIFEEIEGEVHATGVEFAKDKNGKKYRAKAKRDIVLSAGSVHSPHILMLSGVGRAEHLRFHKIPIVFEHPQIGQNLVDHPVVDLYFKDKRGSSLNWMIPQTFSDSIKLFTAMVQYFVLGIGGPLATNLGESAAFIRSDNPKLFPSSEYPQRLTDSTSAEDSPDLELFMTPLAYKEHGAVKFDVHSFALHCYLVRPMSTGAVLLKSNDPWQQPSVNPNYLQNPEDMWKLVRGVRALLKIAHTEPLARYLDHTNARDDLDHRLHLKSDAEIAELVKDRLETVYHPTSTCRMAPREEGGVVDAKLKVYGIHGLRVCDASIFPSIISGHTAGGCFAIAEKLADDMKAEYMSA